MGWRGGRGRKGRWEREGEGERGGEEEGDGGRVEEGEEESEKEGKPKGETRPGRLRGWRQVGHHALVRRATMWLERSVQQGVSWMQWGVAVGGMGQGKVWRGWPGRMSFQQMQHVGCAGGSAATTAA